MMTKLSASIDDSSRPLMEDGSTSPSFHVENTSKPQCSWLWYCYQFLKIAFLPILVVLAITVLYQLKHDPFQIVVTTDSVDERSWSVIPWSDKHDVLQSTVDAALSHGNIQESVKECNKDDHPCWHFWRLFSSDDSSDDSGEAYPFDDYNGVQSHHHHHRNYNTVADNDCSGVVGAVVDALAVSEDGGWNKVLRWVCGSSSDDSSDDSDTLASTDSRKCKKCSRNRGWFWRSKTLPLEAEAYPSDDSNDVQPRQHRHGNHGTVADDDFSDDIGAVMETLKILEEGSGWHKALRGGRDSSDSSSDTKTGPDSENEDSSNRAYWSSMPLPLSADTSPSL
jgi:hypothetical protein